MAAMECWVALDHQKGFPQVGHIHTLNGIRKGTDIGNLGIPTTFFAYQGLQVLTSPPGSLLLSDLSGSFTIKNHDCFPHQIHALPAITAALFLEETSK